MTDTVYTYEDHNLGDQLIFLHLLRALAKPRPKTSFVHFCGAHHHAQLREVVQDLSNIALESFESELWRKNQDRAFCVWKNDGDAWVQSNLRWNWSGYALWHHGHVARQLGFESPFTRSQHLLFDFPALDTRKTPGEFDVLVINSEPCSGQFRAMAEHGSGYFNELAEELGVNHRVITTLKVPGIPCTMDYGEHISGIGCIARTCRMIVGLATGPWWPCLSTHVHHNGTPHGILLDEPERLNMPNVSQFGNIGELRGFLRGAGWL